VARYAAPGEQAASAPSPEAPQVSFTFKFADVLVSKGAAANFIAHLTFHITLTPSGFEVVTTFDRAERRG
jgi:hypothetical protein